MQPRRTGSQAASFLMLARYHGSVAAPGREPAGGFEVG
jgi:hypothetical protein